MLHRISLVLLIVIAAPHLLLAQEFRNLEYGIAVTFPEKHQRTDIISESTPPGMTPPVPFEHIIVPVLRPRVGMLCMVVAFHLPLGATHVRGLDSIVDMQLGPIFKASMSHTLMQDSPLPGKRGRSRVYKVTIGNGMTGYVRADILIREPIVATAIYGVGSLDEFEHPAIAQFFGSFRMIGEDSVKYLKRTLFLDDGSCGAEIPAGFITSDASEFEIDIPVAGSPLRVTKCSLGGLTTRCDILHVVSDTPLDTTDPSLLSSYHDAMIQRNPLGVLDDMKGGGPRRVERHGARGQMDLYSWMVDGRSGGVRMESYVVGNNIYTAIWTTQDVEMFDRPIVEQFFDSLIFTR